MRVRVPVHTFGEPQGVKMQGGVFETVTREVEIECLPGDIPEEFKVDVSEFMIGKQLRAGDLPIDPGRLSCLPTRARAGARGDAQEGRRARAGSGGGGGNGCQPSPKSSRRARRKEEGEAEGAAEAAPKAAEKKEKEK